MKALNSSVPGNPANGFESDVMKMAAKTWNGQWWKYGGGGTAWDSFAYDPELDLLYIGTGNGSPWNREIRSPGGGGARIDAAIRAPRAEALDRGDRQPPKAMEIPAAIARGRSIAGPCPEPSCMI